MTVGELREWLSQYDDELPVWLSVQGEDHPLAHVLGGDDVEGEAAVYLEGEDE